MIRGLMEEACLTLLNGCRVAGIVEVVKEDMSDLKDIVKTPPHPMLLYPVNNGA